MVVTFRITTMQPICRRPGTDEANIADAKDGIDGPDAAAGNSRMVASAYPDPPFDLIASGSPSGFDIELMRAICAQLG